MEGMFGMISNQDIIILSGMFYDDLWTSKQQIARILATRNRILFVEPYLTLITPKTRPELRTFWKQSLGQGALRKMDGMNIYVPPPLLPFRHRSTIIQFVNDYFYTQFVKRIVKKLGMQHPILYSFVYDTVTTVGKLNEKHSIYHCADDWAEMPIPGKVKERVRVLEGKLAGKVDTIFSAAEKNAQRLRQFNGRSFHVPNGVDFDLFNLAVTENYPIPVDLKEVPPPRIGFIGTLDVWVDYDLIEYIARQRPDWSLVLIGPAKVDLSRLQHLQNIYLLGKKPRTSLPAYLQAVEACLIPFLVNDLTKAVNPLKMYEYLAAGKIVVSTDLPEVRGLHPYVLAAASYKEFVRQLEQALEQNGKGTRDRITYAKENSWHHRVEQISALIEQQLSEKEQ